ncbi:histone-lysine N-methyltransferase 2D-like isoform X2 [Acipenser ruthenus]|uniref:histone-lysine N-methyltransferase 2D-like isoform X2 n=1 Tax=Acipenser ruthenus TaxID=7906 RepID=UPI0027405592|nr:histone-lysine N-methyltransferase 2D-like isoform X2 [Acipenser ruthenus]
MDNGSEPKPPDNKKRYFCETCNVSCTSTCDFKQHMAGRKHKLRAEAVSKANRSLTSTKNPAEKKPSENTNTTQCSPAEKKPSVNTNTTQRVKPWKVQNLKTLEPSLQIRHHHEPIIGLQHVVEFRNTNNEFPPHFLCKLCKVKGNADIIVMHIISTKHRSKYLKLKPAGMIPEDDLGDVPLNKKIRKKAMLLEQLEGRGVIKVKMSRQSLPFKNSNPEPGWRFPNVGPGGMNPNDFPPGMNPNDFPPGMNPNDFPPGMNPNGFPRGMDPNDFPRGMHPNDFPPGVNPNDFPPGMNPNDFPPGVNPNDFPPGVNPNDFPPGVNPNDFPPGVNPNDFPPRMNPNDFPPRVNPNDFPPRVNPNDFPPGVNPNDFPPGVNPNNFPPGVNPNDFPPGVNPNDFPPGMNPSDFHPGMNPNNFPTGMPHGDFSAGIPQDDIPWMHPDPFPSRRNSDYPGRRCPDEFPGGSFHEGSPLRGERMRPEMRDFEAGVRSEFETLIRRQRMEHMAPMEGNEVYKRTLEGSSTNSTVFEILENFRIETEGDAQMVLKITQKLTDILMEYRLRSFSAPKSNEQPSGPQEYPPMRMSGRDGYQGPSGYPDEFSSAFRSTSGRS